MSCDGSGDTGLPLGRVGAREAPALPRTGAGHDVQDLIDLFIDQAAYASQ